MRAVLAGLVAIAVTLLVWRLAPSQSYSTDVETPHWISETFSFDEEALTSLTKVRKRLDSSIGAKSRDRRTRVPQMLPSIDNDDPIQETAQPKSTSGAIATSLDKLCGKDRPKKLMLILPMTRITDFDERRWLRQWYADSGFRDDVDFLFPFGVLDFFPGKMGIANMTWKKLSDKAASFKETIESLRKEDEEFGDLFVMSDFYDRYENLAVKSELSLRAVSAKCAANYSFIVKSDIDAPPNVYVLKRMMREQLRKGADDKLFGVAIWGGPIIRYNHKNKEAAELPYRHFHPYCSGVFYFATPTTFRKMMSRSSAFGQHKNEDALMGYLAHHAGVKVAHDKRVLAWLKEADGTKNLEKYSCDEVLAVHRHSGKFDRVKASYEYFKRVCTGTDEPSTSTAATTTISRPE